MALEKFTWQNGTQIEPAKVEIGGQSYNVSDAQYEGETPLSAANLNLMQDTLLANVKNDLTDDTKIPSVKAVKEVYSTTEKIIGTWADGKPLYRKVIFINSLPNNTSTNYPHNISNVDLIWFDKTGCFAIWNYGQDNQFTNDLPYFNFTGSHIYLANANKTGFEIVTINDRSSLKGNITLLYTKTTD